MKRASLHRRRFPTPLILNRCLRGRNAMPTDFIRQASTNDNQANGINQSRCKKYINNFLEFKGEHFMED